MASATATAPIIDDRLAATKVAAIIVNYRTARLAIDCLDALAAARTHLPALRAIVVDGGSGDDSPAIIAAAIVARGYAEWVALLPLGLNGGFGYANNQAVLTLAAGADPPDFLFLINPDARPYADAPMRLVRLLLDRPRAAAVGASLEGEDGVAQGAAFAFPSPLGEFAAATGTGAIQRLLGRSPAALVPAVAARVPWVTGAAVVLRLAALREVGLFDDGFFLYFEEVELMHRLARAGWEIWHEPAARVVHVGGASTKLQWEGEVARQQAPLPPYWYVSRRRYFGRIGGRVAVVAAGAGFIAGRMLWLARCALERRADGFPRRMARDMARHALIPRKRDVTPTRLPRLGDAPGALPAWMRDDHR